MKKDNGPLDAVQEAMGVVGPWHIILAISLSLVNFPVAWHQLSIVFLAPTVNFTCASPISLNRDSPDQCQIDMGNGTTEKCTEFDYDRSVFRETIVTQWNLICDREPLANLAQSVTMFGILVGNMVFSMMADRIGRKTPLMIAVLLQSLTGLLSAFSPWYELFLVLKFITGIATGGTMLISFVLLMEIMGIEWRSTLSVAYHIPFLLGHLTNPLVSYLTRTWYGFQIATSIPPILLLSYYWIIPESPRWLLAVGKLKEAEEVLTKAAKKNKVPLSNVKTAIKLHETRAEHKTEEARVRHSIVDLFKTPNLRIKTICICFNWFVCGICFFGLAQYIGYLSGNMFINMAASAAMELPGLVIVLFLISRVSRLKLLMCGNVLSGISMLLLIATLDSFVGVCLAILGLIGMTLCFPTIYLYSGELFPTVVRNAGIGLASVCARTGSIIAPYIATMGSVQPWLPPLFFGVGPLIGAGLCLLLPETMGFELPETIEDGENFGKKKSRNSEA